jgi:HK97 family phage prohead protease
MLMHERAMQFQTRISGFASLFHRPDLGGDTILPGAFSHSLQNRPAQAVKMLYQHDLTRPIGTWTRIAETANGLWVEGYLVAQVRLCDELSALMRAGALDGLSIGYRPVKARGGRGQTRRYLEQVDLLEISIVTFPMQPLARLRADPLTGGQAADAPPRLRD